MRGVPRSAKTAALALLAQLLLGGIAGATPYPWIIGHRGGVVFRPENTLLAYDHSLANGATGVEFDVWLSSDGFPVLHHDQKLNRTTDGTGNIFEKTLAEILSLDAGSWFGSGQYAGTPVPRLEEGLQSVDGLGKLFLDIKSLDYVATVVQTIEDEGFEPDDVYVWNRFGTGNVFAPLMPDAHIITSTTPVIDREWRIYERTLLGQEGVDTPFSLLDKDYVDLAHSYGLLMMSAVVTPPHFQSQLDIGVDIIVAGNPTFFADVHHPLPDRACSDGADNDGDGNADFPDDPSCWSEAANTETTACSDGIDDDGDGLTDYPNDPGCFSPFYTTESPECSDGIDNNGDGDVDFPADAGCFAAFDQGELAACANGLDDDGDGYGDYPADKGCANAWGSVENPECSDGLDNDGDGDADWPSDDGCSGRSDKSEKTHEPACNDALDNDSDGLVDHPDDPECLGPNDDTERSECDDGIDNDGDGLDDTLDPDCTIASDLTEQTECRNGLDDDGDGRIDLLDPGCTHPDDRSESVDCADGIDNDGDLLTDHPNDPDCQSAEDGSELPACRDRVDNDGDHRKDHPSDTDCESPDDPSELPECQDGIDNDGDLQIDGLDDGCWGPIDPTEEPDCNDGRDNDGDGLFDHPDDPECAAPDGAFEWILSEVPSASPAGLLFAALGMWGASRLLRRQRPS